MSTLLLGGLALYALTRPREIVSHAALTSLSAITDTRYVTLTPVLAGPAVEITDVQIIEDPVVIGTYPKVWVYLKANSASPLAGDFCRIYDDDTGVLVGVKKNWVLVAVGDTWIAKYDGIDDWNTVMPDRTWNLRIETGTN